MGEEEIKLEHECCNHKSDPDNIRGNGSCEVYLVKHHELFLEMFFVPLYCGALERDSTSRQWMSGTLYMPVCWNPQMELYGGALRYNVKGSVLVEGLMVGESAVQLGMAM